MSTINIYYTSHNTVLFFYYIFLILEINKDYHIHSDISEFFDR